MDTIKQIIKHRQAFERDGRQALGVRLPADMAKRLRWELHQYYGMDPGEQLTTLYGMEILDINAPEVSFEE